MLLLLLLLLLLAPSPHLLSSMIHRYIDFPTNSGRDNTKRAGVSSSESMCLGLVKAWVTNSRGYAGGVAGGNGMIMSGSTQVRSPGTPNQHFRLGVCCMSWCNLTSSSGGDAQARPNLARLLSNFAQVHNTTQHTRTAEHTAHTHTAHTARHTPRAVASCKVAGCHCSCRVAGTSSALTVAARRSLS